ncbi:MAG TPA: c-type cytochrome [Bacteroidia bacterium]|nr:c-type cytochrome [Bacteroidia bacterium]
MYQGSEAEELARRILKLSNRIIFLLLVLALIFVLLVFNFQLPSLSEAQPVALPQADENGLFTEAARQEYKRHEIISKYWQAPDISEAEFETNAEYILYGKELIEHTARYFGPEGRVSPGASNGMNCQNCHLDAGTRIFGNNYGSVASTYPKYRARAGRLENAVARINDCFVRSLNGEAIDSSSREMKAILAYMFWLGKNVIRGQKAPGSGFVELDFPDRAADTSAGKKVYSEKCSSCHQIQGEGLWNTEIKEYTYPPLWGPHSYNDGAGMFRLSTLARYVKTNMPFGSRFDQPQLSDAEAWDVSAYINSRSRPHKSFRGDWPKLNEKPVDHPFGPYADPFSEQQHKYGPFLPIVKYLSSPSERKSN